MEVILSHPNLINKLLEEADTASLIKYWSVYKIWAMTWSLPSILDLPILSFFSFEAFVLSDKILKQFNNDI